MPRSTDGNMTLSGDFAISGQIPIANTINGYINDILTNITDSICRSGKGAVLADIDWGSHKILNLADGTAPTDAVTVQQVPLLSANNIFTGTQTVRSADAGAGTGPILLLDRNSATPAAGDALGAIEFDGRDSAGNQIPYGYFGMQIVDPTDASEDGKLWFNTVIAGTNADRFYLGQGFYAAGVANITGSSPATPDPGDGAFNAKNYYLNGALLTLGGVIFAHALPAALTYKVMINSPIKFDINKTTTICRSGTCTATWKINGVAIGGAANAVTSTEQIILRKAATPPETAITVNIGDDLEVTISAVTGCVDMDAMIEIIRVG